MVTTSFAIEIVQLPNSLNSAIIFLQTADSLQRERRVISVRNYGVQFQKPRGFALWPYARLYCVAQDEVVAFDFETGDCLDAVVRLPGLNGQAVTFFP